MATASHSLAAVGRGCSLPVQLLQGQSMGQVSQWSSSRQGKGSVQRAASMSGVQVVKEVVKMSAKVTRCHPWLPRTWHSCGQNKCL